MANAVATVIVEPRFLVREALASLMGGLSYRVVCSVGTTANMSAPTIGEGRKLVILGALSAEDAAREIGTIRKLWPDSKLMLLLESASSEDLQALLTSQIDGCVPLFVSPETLSSTLELIIGQDLRVMILGDMSPPQQSASERHAGSQPNGATPLSERVADASAKAGHAARQTTLSEREAQIIDGLVKGHANKVIARTCDISESTVKVHMKSILRKIRVTNRTQVAIWAMAHGYSDNDSKDGAAKTERNGHLDTASPPSRNCLF